MYDLLASENPRKSAQLCPPKGRQNALLLSLMLQMPDESDRRKQTKGSSNCESGEKSGFAAAAAAATQTNTLLSTNRRSLLSPSTLLTTHSLPHTPPSVHTHPLCQHTGNIETTQMGVVRGNDEMREQKRGCERERRMKEERKSKKKGERKNDDRKMGERRWMGSATTTERRQFSTPRTY